MKRILTDVDGVLLNLFHPLVKGISAKIGKDPHPDWERMYWTNDIFGCSREEGDALTYEYLEILKNEFIEPMPNAVEGVKYLHEKYGVTLVCVTAIKEPWRNNRFLNLRHYFGDAIEEVYCTDGSANKPKYLEQYRDSGLLWVEDLPKNAMMGLELGLDPILIQSEWNLDKPKTLTIARDWLDVVKIYEAKIQN